jgi:hypothetical protein
MGVGVIHVGRLSPFNQWDQNLLDQLFANKLYPTGLDFKRSDGYPNAHGCCLIIPGRYWAGQEQTITEALSTYDWVLAFRTSDEADTFDINKVTHRRLKWWVQTPRTDRNYGDARLFGCGFPPHFNTLPTEPPGKRTDVFLSAQDNHRRRTECFNALEPMDMGVVQRTKGFTQGLPPAEYVATMVDTKVAPAPAGPQTPDTFRLYEALETHTVPIADDLTPAYPSHGYWQMLFPGTPFPILADYESLPAYINQARNDWPVNANRITAWWMRYKRQMSHWLVEDLETLGAL